MKIHNAELLKARLKKEWTKLPANPSEGRLAYVNNELYIFVIELTEGYWVKLSVDLLEELNDVEISDIQDGHVLQWSIEDQKWKNKEFLKHVPALQVRSVDDIAMSSNWRSLSLSETDVANNINVLNINSSNTSEIEIKEDGFYSLNFTSSVKSSRYTLESYIRIVKNNSSVIPGSERRIKSYRDEIHMLESNLFAYLTAGDFISIQYKCSYSDYAQFLDNTIVTIFKLTGAKGEKGEKGDPGSAGILNLNLLKDNILVSNDIDNINFTGNVDLIKSDDTVEVRVNHAKSKIIQLCDTYGNKDINTSTPTAINFDLPQYGDSSYYDHFNNRIYILKSGIYRLTYNVSFEAMDNSRKSIKIQCRKNNNIYVNPSSSYGYTRNKVDKYGSCSATCLISLSANDYVELMGKRVGSTGQALTVANESWFILELVREN